MKECPNRSKTGVYARESALARGGARGRCDLLRVAAKRKAGGGCQITEGSLIEGYDREMKYKGKRKRLCVPRIEALPRFQSGGAESD